MNVKCIQFFVNMQLIGVNECTKRISDLILRAKEAAGIDPKTQLKCIGLSLSGADQLEAQEKVSSRENKSDLCGNESAFVRRLRNKHAKMAAIR